MAMADHTNLRDHFRLPVVAAVAVTTLTVAMAGTPAASSGPSSPFPGFLLDRGRYIAFEVAGALTQTFPVGINDRGQSVGFYDDARGLHGFLRQEDGRSSTIDFPGARATEAFKINDRGQIVGIYDETAPFDFADGRGFLLDRGRFKRIDVPGALRTEASGINRRGQVVGEYVDADGRFHGFLWDKGQFTTIDVPGAAATAAADINDRGQIIGTHTDDPAGATVVHGFLLIRGYFTTFDAPGLPITQPTGINNRGQIVGSAASDPALTEAHGFLLAKGVEGDFTPIDFPGAPRTVAFDINNRGQIVGAYENPDAAPDDQPSPMRMPMMPGL
jgi:probable HAF family extracellular repeat protein